MGYTRNCEPLRVWNRLEPRTRQADFSRVLRAEVYDGLWMLARQWQFGEFHGEDTGSAIFARLAMRSAKIDALRGPQGEFAAYDDRLPIETRVERQTGPNDWNRHMQLGRQWLRILDHYGDAFNAAGGSPAYDSAAWRAMFLERFPLHSPEFPNSTPAGIASGARMQSNMRLQQMLGAAAGRLADGGALLDALPDAIVWSKLPTILRNDVDSGHRTLLLNALRALREFAERNLGTDTGEHGSNWQDAQLEYRFSARVPRPGGGQLALEAEEFHGGRIDWHSFDLGPETIAADGAANADVIEQRVLSVIPGPAEFPGQPQARFWEFEDGAVDLGNLRADSTDLARILVTEYALVYGNNWLVIPCPQNVGTLAEILGIVVEDVFGQRTLVQSATRNASSDWTRWDMFSLGRRAGDAGDAGDGLGVHLLIPPGLNQIADSEAQESVRLLRDEMSNTVWAIETRVPDGLGQSRDGHDTARRFSDVLRGMEPLESEEETLEGAELRYQLANTVPENWIPFLPVHRPGEDREIRLQRASMPRFFQQTVRPVRPLTRLLRPGLLPDNSQAEPHFIHEEEVPRAGVRVDGCLRRARWYNGTTFVWYAHSKRSGRGEGSSGLKFDALEELKPQKSK